MNVLAMVAGAGTALAGLLLLGRAARRLRRLGVFGGVFWESFREFGGYRWRALRPVGSATLGLMLIGGGLVLFYWGLIDFYASRLGRPI